MVVRDACPACSSQQFKKNGHIHTGKQNHRCKACGRQFVVHAENRLIAEDQRTLVARLLLENISLQEFAARWVSVFGGSWTSWVAALRLLPSTDMSSSQSVPTR